MVLSEVGQNKLRGRDGSLGIICITAQLILWLQVLLFTLDIMRAIWMQRK